eukprot:5460076-Alexandrium_andersonii.AAC.1
MCIRDSLSTVRGRQPWPGATRRPLCRAITAVSVAVRAPPRCLVRGWSGALAGAPSASSPPARANFRH